MKIVFHSININSVQSNSGVFTGSNLQSYWSTHSKENSALGTVTGFYNTIHQNVNVVYDNDHIDTPILNTPTTKKKTTKKEEYR